MKTILWTSMAAMGAGAWMLSQAANATSASLQQQQVNLRQYRAEYDVAAQEYRSAGVLATPAPSAQFPSEQAEFLMQFGGSCPPNTQLELSMLRYYGGNAPYYHHWSGSNNLNQTVQSIPTHLTHNAKLAAACNAELQRKIQGGATYNQLKSGPFQLWQVEWGSIKHELTCSNGSKDDKRAKLKTDVVCGPADVRALKRKEKKKAKILDAELTLTGAGMGMRTQNCPVNANLRFYVQTDFPTVVKYQVVTPTGQRSSKRSLPVNLEQANYYEASVNIPFTIPQASGPSGGGLPPGSVQPAGNGLSVATQGPGGPSSGQSSGTSGHAAGSGLQQLNPANLHSNAFRVEILQPKRFTTQSVGYTVECLPNATQTGPGGYKAQPRNTHPNPQINQLQNTQGGFPNIQPLPGTGKGK